MLLSLFAGGSQQPAFHCISFTYAKPASHSVGWGDWCYSFKHCCAVASSNRLNHIVSLFTAYSSAEVKDDFNL